ncbi:hypothetical protein STSP2_01957 [Anaerohalosphaera lusitana]|uniref:Uncharacterized protein n=1 Tax=Anaerohalosphaera lusitana TaxID=1936003 RepID=A0A1U9NM22_9BACT|nr:hypothetical protein [Anaerohalosphaera lusitana]AQT68784.1 hypothetical protein STSP2_01957 [Anaerohalosphaera lusitana]
MKKESVKVKVRRKHAKGETINSGTINWCKTIHSGLRKARQPVVSTMAHIPLGKMTASVRKRSISLGKRCLRKKSC